MKERREIKKPISKPKEDPIEPINLEDGKCLMCGEQSTRECLSLQAKAIHVFMCRKCCLACGMIKEKCKERVWEELKDISKQKVNKTKKDSIGRDVDGRKQKEHIQKTSKSKGTCRRIRS